MFPENEVSFVLTEIQQASACQGSRLPASHSALLPLPSRFPDSRSVSPIMVSSDIMDNELLGYKAKQRRLAKKEAALQEA